MKNKFNPKKVFNKWFIEVFTDDLGYVFMLEKGNLNTLSFNTKQEAIDYINQILKRNDDMDEENSLIETVKSLSGKTKQCHNTLSKRNLLKDIYSLKRADKQCLKESNNDQEKTLRNGSLITLDSIIEFIEDGNYDI